MLGLPRAAALICALLSAGLVPAAIGSHRRPEQKPAEFAGIGVLLHNKLSEDGYPRIVAILPQARATADAGVKPNDLITHIDGKSLKGVKLDDAVKQIRGKEGSVVKLSLKRQGEDKPIEVSITRRLIRVEN